MDLIKVNVNTKRVYRDMEEFLSETFDVEDLATMPKKCQSCNYQRPGFEDAESQLHRCHSNRKMICLGSELNFGYSAAAREGLEASEGLTDPDAVETEAEAD